MRYLIGIDDTDNLQTRGTGFRARQLGQELIQSGLANVFGISRHQLFFDPRVPYTSHNSSACLEVETGRFDYLKHYCSAFLAREAAPGSDAGLCIVAADGLSEEVIRWGARAKCELVTQAEAWTIAKEHGLFLAAFTGNFDGAIGAMAAVGLRYSGNDGRFVWMEGKNFRELSGLSSVSELRRLLPIDGVAGEDLVLIPESSVVDLDGWVRPVLKNGKKIVLIEKYQHNGGICYKCASKELVRKISN
jgi:hypothetical protein